MAGMTDETKAPEDQPAPPAPPTTEQLVAMLQRGVNDFVMALGEHVVRSQGGQINAAEIMAQCRTENIRVGALIDLLVVKGIITDIEISSQYAGRLHQAAAELRKVQIATDVGGIMRNNRKPQ
jgi:hypothetical protein